MMTRLTIGAVLDQLAAEGLGTPAGDAQALPMLDLAGRAQSTPWYIRLFTGLSAWGAALLLIAFLFVSEILELRRDSLVAGLLLCGVGVGLKRQQAGRLFFDQLALVLSLAGQLLFVIGVGEWLDDTTLTALLTIVLQCVLIALYPDRLARWIATLVIVAAMLVLLEEQALTGALHALIFALALGAVALYQYEDHPALARLGELVHPVAYGIVVALLGLLALPVSDMLELSNWWISALLLTAVLLALIVQIALDLELRLSSHLLLGCLAAALLLLGPATRMPGILAALIILLLGFWRSRPLLLGLAALFLVFYLSAYYYTLEWTLLVKSCVLMGSGAILLALRFLLLRAAPGDQL